MEFGPIQNYRRCLQWLSFEGVPMSIHIQIPTPLRHTEGQAVVEVSGGTVQGVLDALEIC